MYIATYIYCYPHMYIKCVGHLHGYSLMCHWEVPTKSPPPLATETPLLVARAVKHAVETPDWLPWRYSDWLP